MGSWSRAMSKGGGLILGRSLHVIRANGTGFTVTTSSVGQEKISVQVSSPTPQPREPGESLLAGYQEIEYRGLSKWNFDYFNSDDIRRSTSEALNVGYKLDLGRFLGQPFIINFHSTSHDQL